MISQKFLSLKKKKKESKLSTIEHKWQCFPDLYPYVVTHAMEKP